MQIACTGRAIDGFSAHWSARMRSTCQLSLRDTFRSRIGPDGRAILPPSLMGGFRLGQRVYFHTAGGEMIFLARPKRTFNGRLLSTRIRRGPVIWRERRGRLRRH